jgi:hypothetical protein
MYYLACFVVGLIVIIDIWHRIYTQKEIDRVKNSIATIQEHQVTLENVGSQITEIGNELKEKAYAEWKQVVDSMKITLNNTLNEAQTYADKQIAINKKDFKSNLDKSYKEACDKINFSHIEYKKTIQTKRKKFARNKNSPWKANSLFRDINDPVLDPDNIPDELTEGEENEV